MIVVANFCNKDAPLLIKNLKWMKELDDRLDYEIVLFTDTLTTKPFMDEARKAAAEVFEKVTDYRCPPCTVQGWPQAPNWGWQQAAFAMSMGLLGDPQPWLFLEPDAIPVSRGWVRKLREAYTAGGKPFFGRIVYGVTQGNHFNGVAVYPPNVFKYLNKAINATNLAWDVAIGMELWGRGIPLVDMCCNAERLITHCWAINTADGKCCNDSAMPQSSFPTMKEVKDNVDFEAALFHRNKDGTLIDRLREWYRDPSVACVPDHGTAAGPIPVVLKPDELKVKYTGKADVLIVTYWKDEPWLSYCLKAMRKHLRGINAIQVVASEEKSEGIIKLCQQYDAKLSLFMERKHKGMLHHMVQICSADLWCKGADIVIHFDPDCIFHTPTTVDEYVVDNQPVMLKRSYEGMKDPKTCTVSDCYQWKAVVEKDLGISTDVYTMCRHPSCHPIGMYKEFRSWIEQQHSMSFDDYVFEQRNEFPQSFAEFPALGAFAWEFFRDWYHWIDIDREPPPKDRQKTFWSHGGITPEIKKQLDEWTQ